MRGLSRVFLVVTCFTALAADLPAQTLKTPEDVVYVFTATKNNCIRNFPTLKEQMDIAYGEFRARNQKHFDMILRDPDFLKNLDVVERHFSDIAEHERECQKILKLFNSVGSTIRD